MRSRYCAYVMADAAYLLASWHRTTRPARLHLADEETKWVGLEVMRHAAIDGDSAIVEFVARFKLRGRAGRLHETSRFVCEHGRWYYVDGEFPGTGAGA